MFLDGRSLIEQTILWNMSSFSIVSVFLVILEFVHVKQLSLLLPI